MPIHRLEWNEPAPAACRNAMLSIGNFDGVHCGHVSLLKRLRAHAADLRVPAVAMTFDPHPLLLLRPESYQPTLTTVDERAQLLLENGVDHVIILRTRQELLQLSAADFFKRVIQQNLQTSGLVEGPNFGFGHNREGNVETLARLCAQAGMVLEIVQPLQMDGVIVSSSRVRQALVNGDIASATRWLSRPYRLSGVVGTGQSRGQQLGYPTANLTQVPTLIPGDGVYAVRVHLPPDHPPLPKGGWPGAANIGPNPTFGEQERKVEVHLIGFDGELYGQTLAIDFIARLRDTRRFNSVDELVAQLQRDVAHARQLIEGGGDDACTVQKNDPLS